jgi:predicted DNA-binding WGR domain protein
MTPVELRRLDPACNIYRFCRLAIEPDLFGGFRLLRQWGRIGGRGGRIKIAHYDDAALAAGALQRQPNHNARACMRDDKHAVVLNNMKTMVGMTRKDAPTSPGAPDELRLMNRLYLAARLAPGRPRPNGEDEILAG